MIRSALVCVLFLLCVKTNAEVLINASTEHFPLAGHLQVFQDESGEMSFDAAHQSYLDGKFEALPGNLSRGFSHGAYWLRFEINSEQSVSSEWLLEIQPARTDLLSLYTVGLSETEVMYSGDSLPYNATHRKYRSALFRLQLPTGKTEFFLRISSTNAIMAMPILWQPDVFYQYQQSEYFLFGMLHGLMFTVIMFNLISWLISKKLVHLRFLAFVLLFEIHFLTIHGFINQFFSPELTFWYSGADGVFLSLAGALYPRLAADLLHISHRFKSVDRILWVLSGGCIICAIATVLGYYVSFSSVLLVVLFAGIVAIGVPIFHTLRGPKHELRPNAIALLIVSFLFIIQSAIVAGFMTPDKANLMALSMGIVMVVTLLHVVIYQQALKAEQHSHRAQVKYHMEKQAREERDHLLAMITHEIKTPIAIIDVATESLELMDKHADDSRLLRYERIHRAVKRLDTMLGLTISLEKSEHEQEQLQMSGIAPLQLAKETLTLLDKSWHEFVSLRAVEELPEVNGEASMLRFVLLNLMDNALKYSPPKSPIVLNIERVKHMNQKGVKFSINDKAPVIPANMRELIFEKYRRLDESSGTAGLGLGLFLAKRIVSQHHGWIKTEPAQTGGNCFSFWLPCRSDDYAYSIS